MPLPLLLLFMPLLLLTPFEGVFGVVLAERFMTEFDLFIADRSEDVGRDRPKAALGVTVFLEALMDADTGGGEFRRS